MSFEQLIAMMVDADIVALSGSPRAESAAWIPR
jgi:hypothetical protein